MSNFKNKTNSKNQLKTNSTLFLQLGIILALIFVYSAFQITVTKTVLPLPSANMPNNEPETYVIPQLQKMELKTAAEQKEQKEPKLLVDFVIDNTLDLPMIEDIIKEPTPTTNSLDSLMKYIPEDPFVEEPDEVIPFISVEQAPRFPGCTGATEAEYRACFNEKIMQFVSKKFNVNTSSTASGKQKIYVLFEIDKTGEIINIQAKAPYKKLENEAIRVTSKLPKMIPAKQRNRNVGIKYTLPITIVKE